jgi:hypothetical protein
MLKLMSSKMIYTIIYFIVGFIIGSIDYYYKEDKERFVLQFFMYPICIIILLVGTFFKWYFKLINDWKDFKRRNK